MIKLICFIRRKPGMSVDAFRDHWLNHHGPLIDSLPQFRRHVRRYEQNCRLDADYERAGADDFDGVTVQWFETRKDFISFAMEPSYRGSVAVDEDRFLDRSGISLVLTSEPETVIAGERSAATVKLIAMLQRRGDIDRDAFRDHWAGRHASIFRDTPELARHIVGYDQNSRLDADYGRDAGVGFDGVTEQWYASADSFRECIAEPAFQATVFPDERSFLQPKNTRWILTRAPDLIFSDF